MKLTNLKKNYSKKEVENWQRSVLEVPGSSDGGDTLRDYIAILLGSGIAPEEAMKIALLMMEPSLAELF